MRLLVNGENLEAGASTVGGLLTELGIKAGGVAVEVNLTLVKKKDYEGFHLREGDRVEIVNFVGGG